MVINDINAKGGLLGRQIDLYLEDSATIDSVAEAKATKLVQHDNVDVIFGGIYSSTRQAIKGPAVVKGRISTSTRSSMRGRNADLLISVPARCRRSRSTAHSLVMQQPGRRNSICRQPTIFGHTR